ncbi:MAG: oxygenase MpaB family protein [Baekduia sp.]
MPKTTPSRFGDLEAIRAQHDPELVDLLVGSVFETDELADDLVSVFRELPGATGWRMLDNVLRHGLDAEPDAPPELLKVVADALVPPPWVDFELVDRGAVAWWRTGGFLQLIALTAGSLAYGYGTSFARPLILTGRLSTRAPRRLAETAGWVGMATRPGELRPGKKGVRETVHIRMVHALVRDHIRRSGRWDTANWGEPISVGDTAATGLIGFFTFPIEGLRDLGVDYSQDELEAMTHLWSWITYLMGVPEKYLPKNYDEAAAFFHTGHALDCQKVEGADELLDALFFHSIPYDKYLPAPLAGPARGAVGNLMAAFSRRWMGQERADMLDIPDNAAAALAIPALRAAVTARERLRKAGLSPSDERLVDIEFALSGALRRVLRPSLPMRPDAVS